jgi:hypothetical protein
VHLLHPYVKQTEPAVQHLFSGLAAYQSSSLPSVLKYRCHDGMIRMTKEENEALLDAYEAHFALEFARAVLSGSILQIAYTGIKKYGYPVTVSPRCLDLNVKASTSGTVFCVGRLVKNIPLGLLIYAGRIQYNHWEEGEPSNPIARQVFRELSTAYSDDQDFDLGYVLNYPTPRPVSHYILSLELGWSSYQQYLEDMIAILPPVNAQSSSA